MPNGKIQESAMTPSRPSSDAARAAVWTGILGAAKHIGERAPVPMRQRPTVVQFRQGTSDTPLYFIGTGLCELNIAQFMPALHSVFAAEIAWPAAWHDAAAKKRHRRHAGIGGQGGAVCGGAARACRHYALRARGAFVLREYGF